jgi:predicted nuclease with TOPRIM domain
VFWLFLLSGGFLVFIAEEAAQKVNEMKNKLQKAEQDNSTLQATINRLEGQVKRFKTASEKAEAAEEELKAEKRKLQREVRSNAKSDLSNTRHLTASELTHQTLLLVPESTQNLIF